MICFIIVIQPSGCWGNFNKTIYLSINSNKHMKKSDVYMPYDIQK